MKLKDFEIAYIFSYLIIKDKNNNELATINNDFEYGNKIKNYHCMTSDMRTELEKWNCYKDCNVLKIKNADMDNNWENNNVEIVIDYLEEEKKIPEKLKDILRVDDLTPPVDENMYKIWTQTIKNQNKINEICDYLKSKGE